MTSAPLSGTTATAATMERASPSAILWESSPYRFTIVNGGLIIQMQVGNSWIAVTSAPTSVVEQFLMTKGLITPMAGVALHATNGTTRPARTRARAARSGTTSAKTTTVSRA